jgi:hypothetical protein
MLSRYLGGPGWWLHAVHESDQPVQLIRNLGQILLGSAAVFQEFAKMLRVFPEHFGLTPLDLTDYQQSVLEVFDCFVVVHDKTVQLTPIFSHRRRVRK